MNFNRLAQIGLVLAILGTSELSAATYYIDWATGSDSNNGTAKATPWKRCPGMNGFSGSYSHVAGDRFIFKGGVTWPNAAFQLRINVGGSSEAARDYYGVDTSWYTGASWSKPIFDGEHTRVGNIQIFAALVGIHSGSYITIDRIHFRRLAATSTDYGSMCITVYGPVFNLLVTGCEFSDWIVVKPTGVAYTGADAGEWDNNGLGGFGTFGGGHGWTESIIITNCVAHQSGVSQKSGTAYRNAPDVRNCEAYNTVQGVLGGGWVDGCHIHDFPSPTQQNPVSHCNAIQIFGPTFIRNNIIHDLSNETAPILVGVDWCCQGQSNLEAYIYNNVLWNTGWQTPIGFDAQNGSSGVEYYIWNNTVYSPDTWPIRGERGVIPIDYVEIKNNHLITNLDPPYYVPYGQTVIVQNNVTHTTSQASSLGYTIANQFQPTDATKPTIDAGQVISSTSPDRLGVTRPKISAYDAGAYEFNPGGTPIPGTIVFSSSTSSVQEDAANVVLTVSRTGGSSGAIGISYTTQDGSAVEGVNYTLSAGTLSWADADTANKTITIPILTEPFVGSKQFQTVLSAPTGGATLGTPASNTTTITGIDTPSDPILSGLSWPATNGIVSSPFISSNYVWQTSQILDPPTAGRASYTFTNVAGAYRVKLRLKAEAESQNSLFINTNTEPTSPDMIFDVQGVTSGFEDLYVGRRGNGQFNAPEFPVWEFNLPEGTNTLIINGREPYTILETVTLELQVSAPPPAAVVSVSSLSPNNQYFKAGALITNVVTFQTNVVVTGSPRLKLNPGAAVYAAYQSGSGSSELSFLYTVASGENTQKLDYVDVNSLELNGGTIQHAGIDSILTLATPGQPSSISYNKTNVIDTIAPTLVITGPSQTPIGAGASVSYNLTYTDTNFDLSTLTTNEITLTSTGTADAQLLPSTPNDIPNQTVTLVNTSGAGTLSISVLAGTAVDLAGNLAPAAGPSSTVTIEASSVTGVTSLSPNGYYKAGALITNVVSFSTSVVVSGSPRLRLNPGSGVFATYQTGSGTADLYFVYTVAANQNTQLFDYLNTTSLELNGGSITYLGADVPLTLPTPGQPGSISAGKTIVIDTLSPVLQISGPSESSVGAGATVFYDLTYTDLNFDASLLSLLNITLHKTDTADAQLSLSTGTGPSRTVSLTNVSGTGNLWITIAGNTGVDLAGNLANAAGPSIAVSVETYTITIIRSGKMKNVKIHK